MIRFTGNQLGVAGKPPPADRFEREELVSLESGNGPVAVTAQVGIVYAGEWLVRPGPADRYGPPRGLNPGHLRDGGRLQRLGRTLWTKGNLVAPSDPAARVRTRPSALATAPEIITGSWAGFAAAGLAVALAVLVVLLGRAGVGSGGALAVALAASWPGRPAPAAGT